jgi:Phospholipase_D-nuclease N-terminal
MEKMQQRQWQDLPPARQRRLIITGLVQLTLTSLALWDLAHRPAAQIKGNKRLWAVLVFVQPVGPLAYLLFARKR